MRTWRTWLSASTRTLIVNRELGPFRPSTTGCAEGDPPSAAAIVALGYLWYVVVHAQGVQPYVLIDNLDFTANSIQDLVRARQFMLDWTLTVQYTKCWAWGTTADLRKALQFYADTGTAITGQPHLYGTETVPLNEKQLHDLRQTFARALLGNKKQLCGWVVCSMCNSHAHSFEHFPL